jgi:hypothetical protein
MKYMEKLKRVKLLELCRSKKLKGYSKLNKKQLIELLQRKVLVVAEPVVPVVQIVEPVVPVVKVVEPVVPVVKVVEPVAPVVPVVVPVVKVDPFKILLDHLDNLENGDNRFDSFIESLSIDQLKMYFGKLLKFV